MRVTALPGYPGQTIASGHLCDASAPASVASGPEQAESRSLRALLTLCARYMPPADLEQLRRAHALAERAHRGVTRKTGEPYIEHPIAVATITAELGLDVYGVAAALLHDTVEDTTVSLDDLKQAFNPLVASIVDGVTKFSAFEQEKAGAAPLAELTAATQTEPEDIRVARERKERKARQQSETVRKLFLAMGQDPRVVLVKLADRLHNLRTMDAMSQAQREAKSRETLDIYAPLAGLIGLHNLKFELEDRAFAFLQPALYEEVARRVNDEAARRERWANRMGRLMREQLASRAIAAAVVSRRKHFYRAWRDANERGMSVEQLHDILAFRVLVNTPDECYKALGAIHQLWRPSDRISDYIANPKVNGYQSLHTTVFALDNELAQIAIRTHEMHRMAQHGVTTYWLESEAQGMRVDPTLPVGQEELPAWVTQLATWHHEIHPSAAEFVTALRNDLFEEQVFVFTPKGAIKELPVGATVLDLAYLIHTRLGDTALGALVHSNAPDGLLAPHAETVDYVLRSGDVVRVLTDPAARPTRAWLDIARTRYARGKIARALRMQRRTDDGESGPRDAEQGHEGQGREAAGELAARETRPARAPAEQVAPLRHPSGRTALVRLCRLCLPCPGDPVAGLVGRAPVVTVHCPDCRTLAASLAQRRANGAAFAEAVRVTWPELQPIPYQARLVITGQDHPGLMYEVSQLAAQQGLNVVASFAASIQARYKAAITLTLDIPAQTRLDGVMRKFLALPGVVSVTRERGKGCAPASSQR